MPMTRIEPYGPIRPTIRELMECRPAGENDGGVPSKGYLGRPPKSAYRSEDRAEALRLVKAREIQPWRGDDQQENNSKRANRGQRVGEVREEREKIHFNDGKMTGSGGRGAHLAWPGTAKGRATGRRWDWT